VQSKDCKLAALTKRLGDCASEAVSVNLEKLQLGKNSNATHTARELVVVQVELLQRSQTEQLSRQASRKCIKVEVDKDQFAQLSDFRRDSSSQSTTLHAKDTELIQETNFRRNSADQVVKFVLNSTDAALNAGDAGPVAFRTVAAGSFEH
jgi:hypothetical protein